MVMLHCLMIQCGIHSSGYTVALYSPAEHSGWWQTDLISFQCIVIWAVPPWLISCVNLLCGEHRILRMGHFVCITPNETYCSWMDKMESVNMNYYQGLETRVSFSCCLYTSPEVCVLQSNNILKEEKPAVSFKVEFLHSALEDFP